MADIDVDSRCCVTAFADHDVGMIPMWTLLSFSDCSAVSYPYQSSSVSLAATGEYTMFLNHVRSSRPRSSQPS